MTAIIFKTRNPLLQLNTNTSTTVSTLAYAIAGNETRTRPYIMGLIKFNHLFLFTIMMHFIVYKFSKIL
jgi:hypothetical protein